ncbi:MAG: PAS domain S-box protein, partial [Sphingobacteriia bacterium]|nr:PAS domain S-box protein [Sphingobacteriia bacterium]
MLIISFTSLVSGAVATLGLLAWNASERAVASMAEQLMMDVGDRIDQRLATQLAQLRLVVQTNAALIRRGRLDWQDGPVIEQHFAEQLGLFSGVTTIAQATEQQEFRLMMRTGPDARILRRMDASTQFRLNRYQADPEGQPGALLETRDNYDPHNDPPGKPWYLTTRDSGQGQWALSVSLGKGQTRPELISHYSEPFYDPSGVLRGVLDAGMTLTEIGDFLRGLEISANGQAFLIDPEGLLIATSSGEIPFDSRPLPDHAQNVAVKHRRLAASASADPITAETTRQLLAVWPDLAQLDAPRSLVFHLQGKRYLAYAAPLSEDSSNPDWIILVTAPLRDFTALLWARMHQPILLALFVLGIAILLGLGATGWISRPLQQLSVATRRLAEGDFSQPLPATPILELRDLGQAFSTMSSRLHEAFTRLQTLNQSLREAEQTLAGENLRLEERVAERTAELEAARLRLEEVLAQRTESEAKFRGMFEQSPLGVALIDPASGQMLEVNDRLLGLLGVNREELASLGWTGITHPDDLPREQALVARLCAREIEGFELEKRYLRPDGTQNWAALTVASVAISGNDQPLHLCLVEDINARKTAEAQVLASERQLRRILDNMPTAISSGRPGPTGQITYVNEQFERTFGYQLEDIPTVSDWAWRAYPDAAYRQRSMDWWSSAVARATATTGQVESKEFQITCKDGTQRDVIISATVLDDLLLVSFLDISARKQAEARLAESEERFRRAFDDANTGMCLVDLQGHLLQVNTKMSAIFGYRREELEGMSTNDLTLAEDQTVSPAFIGQAIHGGGDSAIFEKRYRHRDGHVIHGQVASSLVRDTRGQPLYFISQVQDITQRKEAEAALAQSMAELEA